MYFGLYQIPSRHHRFDALEAPCPGPDLFDRLIAWLRRILG